MRDCHDAKISTNLPDVGSQHDAHPLWTDLWLCNGNSATGDPITREAGVFHHH